MRWHGRRAARRPVRGWLNGPAKVRVVGSYDPARPHDHHMTGGSLSRWFDVLFHVRTVAPWHPLQPRRPAVSFTARPGAERNHLDFIGRYKAV